jgi:hypothetical protein
MNGILLAGVFDHLCQSVILWNRQLTTWCPVCTCLLANVTFLYYGEKEPQGTRSSDQWIWTLSQVKHARGLGLKKGMPALSGVWVIVEGKRYPRP